MAKDKDYVSFWFWFFSTAICLIPCIGMVFTLVMAFVGENESRKNYFRSILVWWALAFGIMIAIGGIDAFAAIWAELQKHFPAVTK